MEDHLGRAFGGRHNIACAVAGVTALSAMGQEFDGPMNLALLAREAAAERGALDPKPEPAVVFQGPTRLIRVVDERGEAWIDPRTGHKETPEH